MSDDLVLARGIELQAKLDRMEARLVELERLFDRYRALDDQHRAALDLPSPLLPRRERIN